MDVVARRRLYAAFLEKEGPEDRELPKAMDIYQAIVVFGVEPEIGLTDLIGPDIPYEVVVSTTAAIFES